jgi:hypothetical protein
MPECILVEARIDEGDASIVDLEDMLYLPGHSRI